LTTVLFFAAGTIKKAVINDENIFNFIIRKFFEIVIYDIKSKKRNKTEPVCFYRIKETIKSVLRKNLWHPSNEYLTQTLKGVDIEN